MEIFLGDKNPKILKCEMETQMCLWIMTEYGCKRGTWVSGVMVLWHAQEQILWHLMSSSGTGRRLQLLQAALAKLDLIWKMRQCPLMQKLGCVCSHYICAGRLIHGDYWLLKWNINSFSKPDNRMTCERRGHHWQWHKKAALGTGWSARPQVNPWDLTL